MTSPQNIITRLEKLKQWQEDQQRILVERQNTQREMLNIEQQKMYESLGISKDFPPGRDKLERDNNCGKVSEAKILLSPPKEVKRTFLKKGQGLTSRFKLDPDAFRLHNLPKYKYANTHQKFLHRKLNKDEITQKNKRKINTKNKQPLTTITANLIKSQSGTGSHIKSHKAQGLGILEFVRPVTKNEEKCGEILQSDTNYHHPNSKQDKSEHTRDSVKSAELSRNEENMNNSQNTSMNLEEVLSQSIELGSGSKKLELSDPISWAQVLDATNPIPVECFRNNSTSLDSNLPKEFESSSLFELLEKRVEMGDLSLNISSIKQWIANKSDIVWDAKEENESFSRKHIAGLTISPIPFDVDKEVVLDESDEENDSETENTKPIKGHVRFNDNVQVNEVESESESVLSNEIECLNISKASIHNEQILFEKFKKQLFNELDSLDIGDSTLINDEHSIEETKQEILNKSNLLKSRLAELEKEISAFKEHNAELIKLKQEHELDKIRINQDRIEMEEKLSDEKIKIEIYLHDERMKLDEERKKFEKILKDQKVPNRREREEITKLKEQVESLQSENKNKESRHIAAQARLRSQIRVLEKEIKDLNFEVEHLKKEIKKLESENAKLNRMNNSKMLQEINKTISKLAPKMETSEVSNKNLKPVVAKVVSYHQKKSQRNSRSKSVPDMSRDESDSTCEESDDASSETSKADIEDSQYFAKSGNNTNRHKKDKSNNHTHNKRSKKKETTSSQPNKIDLKREIVNTDGSKDIWYPNGNLKKISADGMVIRMLYYNKDIKVTNITEGTVKYYYAETNTWHTTYLDGLEILEFPNGQTEHRYKDGTTEVHFPNGSIRISNPTDANKTEEWRYPDGTLLVQMKNGDKVLSLPNGQKEIHTKIHKRREYPDGTVKIVYPDGSQETRYSNGRVRLKDKDGNLVMDSENSNY